MHIAIYNKGGRIIRVDSIDELNDVISKGKIIDGDTEYDIDDVKNVVNENFYSLLSSFTNDNRLTESDAEKIKSYAQSYLNEFSKNSTKRDGKMFSVRDKSLETDIDSFNKSKDKKGALTDNDYKTYAISVINRAIKNANAGNANDEFLLSIDFNKGLSQGLGIGNGLNVTTREYLAAFNDEQSQLNALRSVLVPQIDKAIDFLGNSDLSRVRVANGFNDVNDYARSLSNVKNAINAGDRKSLSVELNRIGMSSIARVFMDRDVHKESNQEKEGTNDQDGALADNNTGRIEEPVPANSQEPIQVENVVEPSAYDPFSSFEHFYDKYVTNGDTSTDNVKIDYEKLLYDIEHVVNSDVKERYLQAMTDLKNGEVVPLSSIIDEKLPDSFNRHSVGLKLVNDNDGRKALRPILLHSTVDDQGNPLYGASGGGKSWMPIGDLRSNNYQVYRFATTREQELKDNDYSSPILGKDGWFVLSNDSSKKSLQDVISSRILPSMFYNVKEDRYSPEILGDRKHNASKFAITEVSKRNKVKTLDGKTFNADIYYYAPLGQLLYKPSNIKLNQERPFDNMLIIDPQTGQMISVSTKDPKVMGGGQVGKMLTTYSGGVSSRYLDAYSNVIKTLLTKVREAYSSGAMKNGARRFRFKINKTQDVAKKAFGGPLNNNTYRKDNTTKWYNLGFTDWLLGAIDAMGNNQTHKKDLIESINKGQDDHFRISREYAKNPDAKVGFSQAVKDYQKWFDRLPLSFKYKPNNTLSQLTVFNNGFDNRYGHRSNYPKSGDNPKDQTNDGLFGAITDDRRVLGRIGDFSEDELADFSNKLKDRGIRVYLDKNTNYYKLGLAPGSEGPIEGTSPMLNPIKPNIPELQKSNSNSTVSGNSTTISSVKSDQNAADYKAVSTDPNVKTIVEGMRTVNYPLIADIADYFFNLNHAAREKDAPVAPMKDPVRYNAIVNEDYSRKYGANSTAELLRKATMNAGSSNSEVNTAAMQDAIMKGAQVKMAAEEGNIRDFNKSRSDVNNIAMQNRAIEHDTSESNKKIHHSNEMVRIATENQRSYERYASQKNLLNRLAKSFSQYQRNRLAAINPDAPYAAALEEYMSNGINRNALSEALNKWNSVNGNTKYDNALDWVKDKNFALGRNADGSVMDSGLIEVRKTLSDLFSKYARQNHINSEPLFTGYISGGRVRSFGSGGSLSASQIHAREVNKANLAAYKAKVASSIHRDDLLMEEYKEQNKKVRNIENFVALILKGQLR